MKKVFVIIASLIVLTMCAFSAAAQAVKSDANAVITSASGKVGDVVEVGIFVKNCPKINCYDLRVHIDTTKLEYQGYTLAESFSGGFNVPNFKDGEFILVGFSLSTIDVPDGAWVTFRVKILTDKKESIPLTFSNVELLDPDGNECECAISTGYVIANGATAPIQTDAPITTTPPASVSQSTDETTLPHVTGSASDSMEMTETSANESESTKSEYRIVCDFSDGGVVDPQVKLVKAGEDVVLNFIPNDGYHLTSVIVNDETVTFSEESYTIKNVSKDYNIYAVFTEIGQKPELEGTLLGVGAEEEDTSPDELSKGNKTLLIAGVALTAFAAVAISVLNTKKRNALEVNTDSMSNSDGTDETE